MVERNEQHGVVTGRPTKTVTFNAKENFTDDSQNVLSRPEFNTLLGLGKRIKNLTQVQIDAKAAAVEKLKTSMRERTNFTEKVSKKVNVGKPFVSSSDELTAIYCDPAKIIEAVEQERAASSKALKVTGQPSATSDNPPPDVMSNAHLIQERESPSLSFHCTSLDLPLRKVDSQEAFSLYMHMASWDK